MKKLQQLGRWFVRLQPWERRLYGQLGLAFVLALCPLGPPSVQKKCTEVSHALARAFEFNFVTGESGEEADGGAP